MAIITLVEAKGKKQEGILQKHIVDYELEDIGVEAPDYFQGRGVSHSNWDEVSVGVGDSYHAALRDAASQLWDSGIESGDDKADELDTEISKASKKVPKDISTEGDSELLYYAAIYVKLDSGSQEEALDKDPTWGFLGTMKSNYGVSDKEAEKLYFAMLDNVRKVSKASGSDIEQFLDSKWGRHLADELSFFGAKSGADFDDLIKSIQDWAKSPKTKWVVKGINDLEGEFKVENKNMDLATKTLMAVGEASGKALGDLKSLKGGETVMFKAGSRYEGMMGAVAEVHAEKNMVSVRIGKALLLVPPADLLHMDFSPNANK